MDYSCPVNTFNPSREWDITNDQYQMDKIAYKINIQQVYRGDAVGHFNRRLASLHPLAAVQ